MSYRLSRKAEQDLIDIYVASVGMFGVAQAERYQDSLEAAFDAIAAFPYIGRERAGTGADFKNIAIGLAKHGCHRMRHTLRKYRA